MSDRAWNEAEDGDVIKASPACHCRNGCFADPRGKDIIMHVYDIEEALAEADAPGLRRAFQVLTHFPHEGHIEGARTAAKLVALFDTVVLALELDQATMPEKLCRTIEHVTQVPIEPSATYSHGTMVASEYCEAWRAMFLAHADAPYDRRSSSSS